MVHFFQTVNWCSGLKDNGRTVHDYFLENKERIVEGSDYLLKLPQREVTTEIFKYFRFDPAAQNGNAGDPQQNDHAPHAESRGQQYQQELPNPQREATEEEREWMGALKKSLDEVRAMRASQRSAIRRGANDSLLDARAQPQQELRNPPGAPQEELEWMQVFPNKNLEEVRTLMAGARSSVPQYPESRPRSHTRPRQPSRRQRQQQAASDTRPNAFGSRRAAYQALGQRDPRRETKSCMTIVREWRDWACSFWPW